MRVAFEGPMAARAAGIEMVYQDFALVPELTVTQNIFLGREIVRRRLGVGILDRKAMDGRALDLLQRLGLRVPSAASAVRELSGGQQQAVAIARATGFEAKLVIMDEPTANLGASAIDKVRETIARLKARGVAVIIISHRIEDVFAVGDRVMVLRHGHVVGSRQVSDTAADELVHMIVTGEDPRERAARDR
jgi:ABC-type sugar transport system ATPase subunit